MIFYNRCKKKKKKLQSNQQRKTGGFNAVYFRMSLLHIYCLNVKPIEEVY